MFELMHDDPFPSGQAVTYASLMTAVRHAKQGSHTAFEDLYWHYNRPIWKRLVGNKWIAEELHQETFLRAWMHLPKLKDNTQFGPLLYRIAAHLAIDHLRHGRKFEFLPLPEDESDGHMTTEHLSVKGPEEGISEKDCAEQALAQMSPRFRICVLLQDQWGYSQHEIAGLLNISVSCVGSYISRGREQFRQVFQRLASEAEDAGKEERQ